MGHPASSNVRGGVVEAEEEERHLNGVKEGTSKERQCSDFIKYPVRWYILAIYSLFGNMQVIRSSSLTMIMIKTGVRVRHLGTDCTEHQVCLLLD